MNELLGAAAAYSRGFATLLGLEEQEGVPTAAPELVPTLDANGAPEYFHAMGGVSLWGGVAVAAGGAGFRSQVQLVPGEGEIVVLDGLILHNENALIVNGAWSQVLLTSSSGALVARDARRIITVGASGQSATRLRIQNNAALADTASIPFRATIAANTPAVYLPLNLVLVLPWTFKIYPDADNQTLHKITWLVRTRPGTPRELAIGAV